MSKLKGGSLSDLKIFVGFLPVASSLINTFQRRNRDSSLVSFRAIPSKKCSGQSYETHLKVYSGQTLRAKKCRKEKKRTFNSIFCGPLGKGGQKIHMSSITDSIAEMHILYYSKSKCITAMCVWLIVQS